MSRHLAKNLVIAGALVSAGFLGAWLRFRSHLGSENRWTDGAEPVDLDSRDELRFAIWGSPELLPEAVNTGLDELGGAPSSDGRYLVFASGEKGLAGDLYLASLDEGTVRDVRPIEGLNSPADESAPAFGNGMLYFASNRAGGAGGLDLYRAPFHDGLFGPPERLGGSLATTSDETDPAPLPSGDGLVFASDRNASPTGDHDLFLARAVLDDVGEVTEWSVSPIRELSTPFGERDPAFSNDGRVLYFASDRSAGGGDYDLYRSVRVAEGAPEPFSAPERLTGLSTRLSERTPHPSADGFTLLYASQGEDGNFDLARARTRELFRSQGRPVGTIELILFGSLILVALLAWLAKRWERLDVAYKCLVVSIIVHAAFLLWMRNVYSHGGGTASSDGGGQLIRLSIGKPRRSGASEMARNVERGDAVQAPSRGGTGAPAPERVAGLTAGPSWLGSEARASEAQLEAPRSGEAGAPERLAAEHAPAPTGDTRSVGLRSSGERVERLAARVSETALVASIGPPRAAGGDEGTPSRSQSAPVSVGESRPQEGSAVVVAGGTTVGELGAEPGRATPARSRSEAPGVATMVAGPAEQVAPLAETVSAEARLEPQVTGSLERAEGSGPERAEIGGSGEIAELSVVAPARADLPSIGAAGASDSTADAADAPAPAAEAHAREEGASALRPVALAGPAEKASTPLAAETGDAQGTWLPSAPTFSSDHADGALELGRLAAPSVAVSEIRPASAPALEVPARESAPTAELEPRRMEFGSERVSHAPFAIEIAEAPAPEPSSESVASPSLAVAEPGSRGVPVPIASFPLERGGSDRPERFRGSASLSPSEEKPASRAVFAAATERNEDHAPGRDLGATPYRSRVGTEKVLALERYGGSQETEAAVASGLAYLASIQSPRGFWGSAEDRHEKYGHVAVGKTALALLAFLGAGHTPVSETAYAGVARKAVDFLLAIQDGPTGHFGYTEAYSHGIATYALAECYAITREERLRAPIERAVGQILLHQEGNDDPRFQGGWGYYYPDGRVFDPWPRVSITAWQVMALESAQLGGLAIDSGVFARAKVFLERSWDEERGAFRYSHDPSRLGSAYDVLPGSTPAAMFALSLLGEDLSSDSFARARRFVLERAPQGYRFTGDDDFVHRAQGNLYFWYYGTLAMFRVGTTAWERWNVAMKDTLLPSQEADGSWRPICIYAAYAGDDDTDRSYTTAINVLTLEIYYRYFTPLLRVQ